MFYSVRRRLRQRGNLLMIAMALMFILVTLIAALHHYESVSRRGAADAEAELERIQANRWEVGKALGKVSPKDVPSFKVQTGGAVVNGVDAAEERRVRAGARIFDHDAQYAWTGFTDLTVPRQAQPSASATPPPLCSELVLTSKGGTPYRVLTTPYLPYAAYAPGQDASVRFESVLSWANPPVGYTETKARECYTGLPAVVAAGKSLNVGYFPLGTAYCNTTANPIQRDPKSLCLTVQGSLPGGHESDPAGLLIAQMLEASNLLTTVSKSLDDKTTVISGAPPDFMNLINFFFKTCPSGNTDEICRQLLGWTSLRSATEFPFVSLPGVAYSAFPGCYIAIQFWFHGPHIPDQAGNLSTVGQKPSAAIELLGKKLGELQQTQSRVRYLLQQLDGGSITSAETVGGERFHPTSSPGVVYPDRGDPNCPNVANHPEEPKETDRCAKCNFNKPGKPLGSTSMDGLPKVAQVDKGLLKRFFDGSSGDLYTRVKSDVATLETARGTNEVGPIVTDLKTQQDLLIWMADVKGLLLDDQGQKANLSFGVFQQGDVSLLAVPGVDYSFVTNTSACPDWLKDGNAPPPTSSSPGASPPPAPPKVTNPYLSWNNALGPCATTFPPMKDWKGDTVKVNGKEVRDTAKAPLKREFTVGGKAVEQKAGTAISSDQWKLILKRADGADGDIKDQLGFFKLLAATGAASAPGSAEGNLYLRLVKLRADLADRDQKLTTNIARIDTALGLARMAEPMLSNFLTKKNNTVPYTREFERDKDPFKSNKDFQANKGLVGYSYLKYGFSFDVMYKALIWLADHSQFAELWSTRVPTIWYGPKGNITPIYADNQLVFKGCFVVPQGRTFCYDYDMTVSGDVWLKRGATMRCRTLKLNNPNFTGYLLPFMKYLVPSGRLILEEGANLVISGNAFEATGPVVITSQPGKLRPISSGIFVPNGTARLCGGTTSGMGVNDLLQTGNSHARAANKYLYILLEEAMPNLAKVWPLGPFHRRKPFFARFATQYQMEIWIGPFGIPIPLVHPWPLPRDNVQIKLYSALSQFFAIATNANVGENFMLQSDWWIFRDPVSQCGIAPIFPKLDFKALKVPGPDFSELADAFSKFDYAGMPADIATYFWDKLKNLNPKEAEGFLKMFAEKVLVKLIKDAVLSMVPAPFNIATSYLAGLIPEPTAEADLGPFAKFTDGLGAALDEVTGGYPTELKDAFSDGMMHEVPGVAVYARNISVGLSATGEKLGGLTSDRPLMASGLFVATGDIDINAEFTIGAVLTSGGSINKLPGAQTSLLYYPPFTRANLVIPDANPRGTANVTSAVGPALPRPFIRALDVFYGIDAPSAGSGPAGVDVGGSTATVTAEGWQR